MPYIPPPSMEDMKQRLAAKVALIGDRAIQTMPAEHHSCPKCRARRNRYLRQLEREGYIQVYVVPSERTRMCFGLFVRLLNPLIPRHRRYKWPGKAGKPDATRESQIHNTRLGIRKVPRYVWDFLCSQGV